MTTHPGKRLTRLMVVATAAVMFSCSTEEPVVPPVLDSTPPTNVVDTIPPAQITVLSMVYERAPHRVRLEWIAPSDNDPPERVNNYEVRYVSATSLPPDFWENASVAADPPEPAAPGTVERWVFDAAAVLGRSLYVGIRAHDAGGNVSPPTVSVEYVPGVTVVARCTDVFSGLPVPDLHVRVSAATIQDLVTDNNGKFTAIDIPPGAVEITIDKGPATTEYHAIQQRLDLSDDASLDFAMVPYQPTVVPEANGVSMLALLAQLAEASTGSLVLRKWHRLPVRVYIPDWVNGNGFDYTQIALQAMQRWNDRAARTIFEYVPAEPDTGVIFKFVPRDGPGMGVTFHTNGDDGHPLRDDVEVVRDLTISPYLVMLHELGHTIRFGHMRDRAFIMYGGQPLPPDITDDEAAAATLYYEMPTYVDLDMYDRSTPAP